MKCYRTIYLFLILLVVFMIIGCIYLNMRDNKTTSIKNSESNGTILYGLVYIDGNVVDNLPVFVSSTDVGIPFLQTAEVLGMHIEKRNEIVYVTNDDVVYVLQHSPNISLTKQDEKLNLLLPPLGCSSPYIKYDSELNDVFLDYETLDGAFYLMGVDIDTSVDYAKTTVTIMTKNRQDTRKTGDGSVS